MDVIIYELQEDGLYEYCVPKQDAPTWTSRQRPDHSDVGIATMPRKKTGVSA